MRGVARRPQNAEDIGDDGEDAVEHDERTRCASPRPRSPPADRGGAAARTACRAGSRRARPGCRTPSPSRRRQRSRSRRRPPGSARSTAVGLRSQHADADHARRPGCPTRSAYRVSSGIISDERQHPRQHQELHRRDAHGGQRVDLLVHLHRAELRGEGGAGAAGHDDRRHDAAHLAHHRDARPGRRRRSRPRTAGAARRRRTRGSGRPGS